MTKCDCGKELNPVTIWCCPEFGEEADECYCDGGPEEP